MRLVLLAACLLLASSESSVLRAQKFTPGCSLPWAPIAEPHPIDKTCGKSGLSKVSEKVAESEAKNNLCVTGTPTDVDYETLIELQDGVDSDHSVHLGDRNTPSRPTREYPTSKGDLSEGDLVRMSAWVLLAKNSNKSGGENVNCSKSGIENNDIHMVLAKLVDHSDLDEDECHSVTAEAIPHFRPSSWSSTNINSFRDHPVRLTGQLFLDSDHMPCRPDGTGGGPDRASVWEIHPVYLIEICKFTSLAKCSPTSKAAWVAFEQRVDESESNK